MEAQSKEDSHADHTAKLAETEKQAYDEGRRDERRAHMELRDAGSQLIHLGVAYDASITMESECFLALQAALAALLECDRPKEAKP